MTTPNEQYGQLATQEAVAKTIEALKANGMDAIFVANGDEATKKIHELLPEGAEVMNMSSQTLEALDVSKEIVESSRYNAIRKRFASMDPKTQGEEMRRLGAAHEYVIGSIHAVTEDGHVFVASNTGSQLPSYAYGATKVIWVVGSQKIVKNADEAMKRMYEYTLPLEDVRAQKAYGVHSAINKILIVDKETVPGRITMIIVGEKLGY